MTAVMKIFLYRKCSGLKTISNWGQYPSVDCDFQSFSSEDDARQKLELKNFVAIRGNGRSYGDSSLGEHVLSALPANNLLSFDAITGELHCQAGCLLSKILAFSVPQGWFLPVTPGTQFITVGGAVASDVHGKNHHKVGSFGSHVAKLSIMTESGEVLECGPGRNEELFHLTCGGMGMSGLILNVTLQLIPIETSYIKETILPCPNLDAVMTAFEKHEETTYSVAWIDCLAKNNSLGRSLLMLGEHAKTSELTVSQKKSPLTADSKQKVSIPIHFPRWVLNTFTIKAFNALYYHRIRGPKKEVITHYTPFFYPLDAIGQWNNMYGKRGFTQYQFVLPREQSREGMRAILERISESGKGSFLAVLKLLGKQETGLLSFPMEGYTLALDFAMDDDTPALLQELDTLVEQYEGRIYLAKDVFMTPEFFENSYPQKKEFIENVQAINPNFTFQTDQTQRLGLHPCPPS